MSDKKKNMKFGEGLERLESIVEKLEQEEYELEDMIEKFQEGMELYRNLEHKLKDVEIKINKIMEHSEEEEK